MEVILFDACELFCVRKTGTQVYPDGTLHIRRHIDGINDNSNKKATIDEFCNPRNLPIKMLVRIYSDDKAFADSIINYIKRSTKIKIMIEFEVRDGLN